MISIRGATPPHNAASMGDACARGQNRGHPRATLRFFSEPRGPHAGVIAWPVYRI